MVTNGSTITTTDYDGNYIYTNSALSQILQPEGYIIPNGSTYQYYFQYKDNLSSNRLTYCDFNGDGTISPSEIVEEDNYYPFGLKQQGYNNIHNGTGSKFKYNGKELQDDAVGISALNWYDYGARFYDPALGRWTTADPLAEKYSDMSPYAYVGNNPIIRMDIAGMDWYRDKNGNTFWREGHQKKIEQKGDTYKNVGKTFSTKVKGGYINYYQNTEFYTKDKVNVGDYVLNNKGLQGQLLGKDSPLSESDQISLFQDGIRNVTNKAGKFIGMQMSLGVLGEVGGGVLGEVLGRAFSSTTAESGTRVFWSGGDIAKIAAADFAKKNGMKTLEMTTSGRIMNTVGPFLPRSISSQVWDALSTSFAKGATGDINVFQNAAGVGIKSTWSRIEYPILQDENIIYQIVK